MGEEEEKRDIEEQQKKRQAIQKQIEQRGKQLTRSGKEHILLQFLHAWKQITQTPKTKTIRGKYRRRKAVRGKLILHGQICGTLRIWKDRKKTTRSPIDTKSR